ncbi:MAG TPA: CehA/McbA family metallohydrolase [Chloroflexota bacterium]|nr:CehA/McbA family metallohydrolase [Chloroflexota bacterium]
MSSSLFAPVDLAPHFNASPSAVAGRWHPSAARPIDRLPLGQRSFWGVPFHLAPETSTNGATAWVVSGPQQGAATTIPLTGTSDRSPTYLLFAHLCGASPESTPKDDSEFDTTSWPGAITRPGERVANYVLVYADGTEHRQPIRWRFEINGSSAANQRPFAARPQAMDVPVDFRGPYTHVAWGRAQTSVGGGSGGPYFVYALPNPHPDRPLRALRIESAGDGDVCVAGLTCFFGQDHPLRHRRLESFRLTVPRSLAADPSAKDQLPISIDLGIIARRYAIPAFDPESWLAGEGISTPLPDPPSSVPAEPLAELFLDIAASADATLTVGDQTVPLKPAYEGSAAQSTDQTVRVEIVQPHRAWVHVTVQDGATGQPVPSRVHFRDRHGRYLPPYGFRHEVNDNWFEDYGGDLKLHGTEYAYVDGTFQAELPVGEVYVELFKGFEYQPLRSKLNIQPGQRTLELRAERPLDWRSRGWMTADTHVHFISPQTAWLQGRAEGLNLINLLASQWGDLYTNVTDISGGLSGVSRDETLVWVGTENRQHLLGHMSLLGIKGEPVFPMTTGGPNESYLGDPTWTTLAEWSDEARRKDGVVVIPHFPNPYCEVTADILLGKIDAVELNMQSWPLQLHEWYRYLNCGYRVAAVGGTDKMGAYMPVGAIRTYALVEDGQPLSFEAWATAVKRGRTFTTTGPLVDFTLEGHVPGDDVQLPAGGGTLHVSARAESIVPFHALEIVVNGRVVASQRADEGTYRASIEQAIQLPGSGWVAARVASRMDRWIGSPRLVAAHTTPVYVVAGGQELFSPSDASYMLEILEGGLTWMDTLATRADPERHARNRKVFEDARDHLHTRMHARGDGHTHGAGASHTHH